MGTWIYHDVTVAQERAAPVPATQWDYKIIYGLDLVELAAAPDKPGSDNSTQVMEKGLNKLGAENWELVDVTYLGVNTFQYSFKRPKTPK